MTVPNPSVVTHREKVPIRDAQGRLKVVYENEWTESQDTHRKHAAEIEAIAKQHNDDLAHQLEFAKADVERLAAEVLRGNDRVVEIAAVLAAVRAAHKEELMALQNVLTASLEAQIKRNEAEAAAMADGTHPFAMMQQAIVELAARAAAADDVYVLPGDLVDVDRLRSREQELRAIALLTDPDKGPPARLHWVLPARGEAA